MKLVQITDCHVTADTGRTYRGEDPRARLDAVIDSAIAWAPDLVLATGDLSEDASEASYRHLAEAFARLPAPVLAVPGNHDDATRLAAHFPHCAVDAPLAFEDDWQLLLMGSAKPGLVSGRFEVSQLEAMDALLATDKRPALVALHHQPWPVGSPWIDRWPLESPQAFHEVLARHPRVRLVLWGHVHQAVQREWNGLTGLGCPSSVSNSLPGRERFTADPDGPACRWLELAPDGSFATGLLRSPS